MLNRIINKRLRRFGEPRNTVASLGFGLRRRLWYGGRTGRRLAALLIYIQRLVPARGWFAYEVQLGPWILMVHFKKPSPDWTGPPIALKRDYYWRVPMDPWTRDED